MCGIAGVIGPSALRAEQKSILFKIHKDLEHRGPDANGLIEKEGATNIFFSHNRLAIQDLSISSGQPMRSPSGAVIVYNGEIYNGNALRKEIGNRWKFQSSGDTEILLASIEIWGEAALSKIDGIFAFAYSNSDNSLVVLGRDRLGVKPLYYMRENENFWFSSESRVLGKVFNKSLDEHAFHEWAIYQFPVTERTFFKDVLAIPAGHYISIHNGKHKLKRYWNIQDYLPVNNLNTDLVEEKLEENLLSILTQSVSDQLISDVPIAAFTSGGIDSSIVTAIASRYGLDATYTGTYGLEGYDESKYSSSVANFCGVDNQLIKITESNFFDSLPIVAKHLDFPIAGPGSVGQFIVCREASKNHKVILSGSGGDELFLGYTRDRFPLIAGGLLSAVNDKSFNKNLWQSMSGDVQGLYGYEKMLKVFANSGGFTSPIQGFMGIINRGADSNQLFELDEGITREVNSELLSRIAPKGVNSLSDIHSALVQYEMSFFLSSLLQVEDRVSMASGIEIRVPLLSTALIEFILPLNLVSRMYGDRPKDLLRKIAKNLLPEDVILRGDKMGFPVPLSIWAKNDQNKSTPIRDLLESLKENRRNFVKTENIESVSRKTGLGDRGLWSLLALESWYQN